MRAIFIFLFLFSTLAYSVCQDFSLIILPDTQYYAESYPQIFHNQIDWILANRDALNIQFIIHLGDITNHARTEEWQVARAAFDKLDGVIPYALTLGNHDYPHNYTRDVPQFYKDFPVSTAPFTLQGTFEPGKLENNYHIINICSTSYLILGLEFGPRDEVLEWANEIIAQHPECKVFMFTHSYMHSDGTRVGEGDIHNPHDYFIENLGSVNDGEEMWEKLVSRHANMLLTFSGHVIEGDCTGRLDSEGIYGNTVVQMLSNYQTMENGGNGFLRILTFHPSEKNIDVTTFSPFTNTFLTNKENQFTIRNIENAFHNNPPEIKSIPEFVFQEDSIVTLSLFDFQEFIEDDYDTLEELDLRITSSENITCVQNEIDIQFSMQENWFGTDTLKMQVSDSQNETSDSQLFFRITAVNDAPIIADMPTIEGNEDITITQSLQPFITDPDHSLFELSVSCHVFNFIPGSSDAQAEDLNCIYNQNSQELQFLPSRNVFGEFHAELIVCDPLESCSKDTLTIRIHSVNDCPILSTLPVITGNEDLQITLQIKDLQSFVEDDNAVDELSWTIQQTENISIQQHPTYFSIIPDSNWYGSDSMLAMVTDPFGLADSAFLPITIHSINDTPYIADLPDIEFAEDSTASLDTTPYLYDIDHPIDSLDLSAHVNRFTPINLAPTNSAADLLITVQGKTVNFAARSDSCGQFDVEFCLCDPQGACGRDTISVSVIPQNDPPEISALPLLSWHEDDSLFLARDTLFSFISDPDHDKQELSVNLQANFSIDSVDSGWKLQAAPDWFGKDSLFITVSDPLQARATAIQHIHVESVNDAPVWLALPTFSIVEQDSIHIDLKNYLQDVDHSIHELHVTACLSDSSILKARIDQETLVLLMCNISQKTDTTLINLTATDPQGESASVDAQIALYSINNAPNIQALPNITLEEDSEISFPLSSWRSYISDPDHEYLDLEIYIEKTENIDIQIEQKVLTIVPEENWFGTDSLLVYVTDPLGAADSTHLFITVHSVNDVPVISGLPDTLDISENAAKLYLWEYISDAETPPSKLLVNTNTLALSLFHFYDKNNGELILLYTVQENCAHWLTITVTDTENAMTRDSIWVMQSMSLIDENPQHICELALYPCYPNPFNGVTRIQYDLPNDQYVHIKILNVRGRHILDLENGIKKAGRHSLTWKTERLSSGIYFIILETAQQRKSRRCLLVN